MLSIQKISKSYGNQPVLRDLSLEVPLQETVSILGRSGSGKTTLLKIIAGLTGVDSGSIFMERKEISGLQSRQRNIVYLYQESLLFPHLDVFENIAFGLRIRNFPEKEIRARTMEMIENLNLNAKSQSKPDELSGGQMQRVAFGRALIVKPKILLLDEPFGNLDTNTRHEMQYLFKSMVAEFDITSLFVTHDLKEAILMGDRIGLLKDGTVTIYDTINDFINDPETGVRKEQEFWGSLKSGN